MHALAIAAISLATASVNGASVDLSVADVRVQHPVQFGTSKLVAGRTGWVRVLVDVGESPSIVPDVDGLMHVYLNGEEIAGSPFRSLNGPIDARPAPGYGAIDHTLNFPLLVPHAGDVTVAIEIDPWNKVAEVNEQNNVGVVEGLNFLCNAIADMAYVPIDYTPGLGMPDDALMRPGVGDGMIQAVFGSGGVRYHLAPVPPLVWNESIDQTYADVLGILQDIRVNQIPAAGFPRPDFLYGWLPGNPYWGNGHAVSIPGDVAFGNTDPARFQRTFAHEVGHLVGRVHVQAIIGTDGVDVEHHLLITQNLPQLVPSGKFDIMVAGKLTYQAWVNNASFHAFLNDPRLDCVDGAAGGGGGRGGDGGSDADAGTMALRIGGVLDHDASLLAFRPIMPVWAMATTADDPQGDVRLEFRAGDRVVHAVRVRTGTSREICTETRLGQPTPLAKESWVSAIVPATLLDDPQVDTMRAVRVADGAILGERWRSATPPSMTGAAVTTVGAVEGDEVDGPIESGPGPEFERTPDTAGHLEVSWQAIDADGDALVANVLYSPDGARWIPLRIGDSSGSVRTALSGIPAAKHDQGRYRVIVADGFDVKVSEGGIAGAVGAGSAPLVHLVTPNDSSTHLQHAAIILHAGAWDLEDGLLPDSSITWSSSVDGALATGRLLLFDGLSAGDHLLTVEALDSDGMVDSESIAITILPRDAAPSSPDLNGDGVVDGADLGILLNNWSGSGAGDLNGDGVVDGGDLGVLLNAWTG